MKLHPFKRLIIAFITIMGLIGIISTYYLDIYTCNSTKKELRKLYEAEFKDSRINSIIEKLYPSGGQYKLFSVDNTSNYFPILLENMTVENEQYFKTDIRITKLKQSYLLSLKDDEKTYLLTARNPDNEKGLGSISRIIFILIIVFVSGLQLFIPDHYYNKFLKRNKSTS